MQLDVEALSGASRRASSCCRCSTLWEWFKTPSGFWHRPDDEKKTLPDQWRLHSSSWRFVSGLVAYIGPPTHTLSNIWLPVLTVMAISVMILGFGLASGINPDAANNFALLFRLSTFVLSLLLAFRANRTYDRWWMARSSFGGIGGGLVNIVRQVATYTDDPVLIRQYQKWGLCMVYGIVQLINNTPKVTDPRVKLLLDPDELALYTGTTKPSKLCGTMLSALTARAGFGVEREIHINEMLGAVAGHIGTCARIKLQALPYGMSLFCTGYMYMWLLMLPLGIFPEAGWPALLPTFVMTTMMLGLEDLSNQMEDPFKFFAYEAMVATTAKDMPRTVKEVEACLAFIRDSYEPIYGTMSGAAPSSARDPSEQCAPAAAAGGRGHVFLPPWPALGPRRQTAGRYKKG